MGELRVMESCMIQGRAPFKMMLTNGLPLERIFWMLPAVKVTVETLVKAPPLLSQAPPTTTSLLLVLKAPWVMVMVDVTVIVSCRTQVPPALLNVTLLRGLPC